MPIPDYHTPKVKMPLFTVTMTHPNGPAWNKHVRAHVEYLLDLYESQVLKASGPLKDQPLRTGFMIVKAADRAEVERIVAADPFSKEGIIVNLSINEWDPLFGVFGQESSQFVPPGFEDLAPRLGYEGESSRL